MRMGDETAVGAGAAVLVAAAVGAGWVVLVGSSDWDASLQADNRTADTSNSAAASNIHLCFARTRMGSV